ncbi:NADPH-dependent FMN reductase (plasmid) [Arthrobacter alpinus]|uniref:flavodoxin family protein n=1 Tax=Arthrobacter alpinus TaxID=656366 RepID=UPI0005C8491A|nr:flavodoxin family protein [Arthrobacter alpinus]ALV47806.1 NADPH-dependent FMN reductase [Arthrobacter alpinus]ALV47946.1 NADPH-dependent FMN reductase [Arthrobacter alpinus]
MENPTIAVAYYSGSGHTQVLAEAVAQAAAASGATTKLLRVDQLTQESWDFIDEADAIIFGAPTYMGTAPAAFHAFAEQTAGRWAMQKWSNKLGAGFTNAACKAGDKNSTLDYFSTLAAQHGMNWINLGLLPGWKSTKGSENDLNRFGYFNGAAAQTFSDVGIDGVHPADIATAVHLGKRVAEMAAIFTAGRSAMHREVVSV